jgi:hypothetical protein
MPNQNRVFARLVAKEIPKKDLDKIGGAGGIFTPTGTKKEPTVSYNFQTGFERIDDTAADFEF